MSLVEFKNVYKRYKMGEVTINAVDGISFCVEEGEFAVVVGASGAGKTTVLNLLGGMDSATEGEILVGGRDISRCTVKPRSRASGCRSAWTIFPHSYRAASSSAYPLHAPLPSGRHSCCATSRRVRSITTQADRFCHCCRRPAAAKR